MIKYISNEYIINTLQKKSWKEVDEPDFFINMASQRVKNLIFNSKKGNPNDLSSYSQEQQEAIKLSTAIYAMWYHDTNYDFTSGSVSVNFGGVSMSESKTYNGEMILPQVFDILQQAELIPTTETFIFNNEIDNTLIADPVKPKAFKDVQQELERQADRNIKQDAELRIIFDKLVELNNKDEALEGMIFKTDWTNIREIRNNNFKIGELGREFDNLYICIRDIVQAHTADTEHFKLIVKKYAEFKGNYQDGRYYNEGDMVIKDNKTFISKTNNNDGDPLTNTQNWASIAADVDLSDYYNKRYIDDMLAVRPDFSFIKSWMEGEYDQGDLIEYDKNIYFTEVKNYVDMDQLSQPPQLPNFKLIIPYGAQYKGDYTEENVYYINDIVKRDNKVWLKINGNRYSDDETWNDDWVVISGQDGGAGGGGTASSEIEITEASKGQVLIFESTDDYDAFKTTHNLIDDDFQNVNVSEGTISNFSGIVYVRNITNNEWTINWADELADDRNVLKGGQLYITNLTVTDNSNTKYFKILIQTPGQGEQTDRIINYPVDIKTGSYLQVKLNTKKYPFNWHFQFIPGPSNPNEQVTECVVNKKLFSKNVLGKKLLKDIKNKVTVNVPSANIPNLDELKNKVEAAYHNAELALNIPNVETIFREYTRFQKGIAVGGNITTQGAITLKNVDLNNGNSVLNLTKLKELIKKSNTPTRIDKGFKVEQNILTAEVRYEDIRDSMFMISGELRIDGATHEIRTPVLEIDPIQRHDFDFIAKFGSLGYCKFVVQYTLNKIALMIYRNSNNQLIFNDLALQNKNVTNIDLHLYKLNNNL